MREKTTYYFFLSFLGIIFSGIISPVFAQDNQLIDSLSFILKTAKEDTNKVLLLNNLAWELKFDDPQQARTHLNLALILAQKLNYLKGTGDANNYRGVVEDIHGNSNLAISFFEKALKIRQQLNDLTGVASLFNNIGNVCENLGNFDDALDNYHQSLQLREELKDSIRMGRLYNNISILQEGIANYPEALDYCLRYLTICEITGNRKGKANAYNLLGNIRVELDQYKDAKIAYQKALIIHQNLENEWEKATVLNNLGNLEDSFAERKMLTDSLHGLSEHFDASLEYFQQALAIRKNQEDRNGEAEIYNNIGYVLKNIGSYYKKNKKVKEAKRQWKEALLHLEKSLQIQLKLDNIAGVMKAYNGIGDVYRRRKNHNTALEYTQKYYKIAKKIGASKYQQNGLKDFARIYFQIGQLEKAYKYRKAYDELRYSLYSADRIRLNARRESLYTDGKKALEIEKQKRELLEQERAILEQQTKLERANFFRNSLITGAFALILLIGLLINRNRIKTKSNEALAKKNEIIDAEKKRAESLLLNILPKETARELQEFGKAKAIRYDSVTVLFTDFKSFTQIAENLSPEELVHELDTCFRAFDEIIERYNLEKIKTIGDAYMCAGGLPTKNNTHPFDVVEAAIAIRDFMDKFNHKKEDKGKPKFEIRIGINTGAVVAGVVGSKKFAYDIWGDTVNLAARMEQNSKPGKINISQSTFELIKTQYDCQSRGKINAKNKGEIKMFFVKKPAVITSMNYKGVKKFILEKLEKELSTDLHYHGLHHTLDVLAITKELCLSEKIASYETILLKTAVLFHDSGFMISGKGHEAIGCNIARKHLPNFNYSAKEIEQICGMIMATKIPQSPQNQLEEIICDADLDYLGRDDFYSIGECLFKELKAYNILNNVQAWNKIQVSFLTAHSFFTKTNKERRKSVKQKYLEELEAIVSQYNS